MTPIKSKRGAVKRFNALYRKAERTLSGGLSFGIDWPTLRLSCPDIYAEMQAIRESFASLPA